MKVIPMIISKDLKLNVVGLKNQLFNVAISVIKAGFGLFGGRLKLRLKLILTHCWTHPATSTTSRRLNHDRKSNLLSNLKSLNCVSYNAV